MRKIEDVRYCEFIPTGKSDFWLLFSLIKWIFYCWLKFYPWIVVVETCAAGRSGGKNLDIYISKKLVSKNKLMALLAEPEKREKISLLNCLTGELLES